jgi:hypothetical protein
LTVNGKGQPWYVAVLSHEPPVCWERETGESGAVHPALERMAVVLARTVPLVAMFVGI